jgi:hypothetical protein
MAAASSITFDTSRYEYQGEREGGVRVWFLPEGGGVGIYPFDKPDLPENASLAELRTFYEALGKDAELKILDFHILQLDGVQSIKMISKVPDPETGGIACLGSLTIPFHESSFVVKIQCFEDGVSMTGWREGVLLDEALRKGTARMESDRLVFNGWTPYDEQFDDRFPLHPVTRVRKELRHIASSLRIDPRVKNLTHFGLPSDSESQSGAQK